MIKHEIEFNKMGARAFTGTGSLESEIMKTEQREKRVLRFYGACQLHHLQSSLVDGLELRTEEHRCDV